MGCKTTNQGTGRLAVSCILLLEVHSKLKIQCTKSIFSWNASFTSYLKLTLF